MSKSTSASVFLASLILLTTAGGSSDLTLALTKISNGLSFLRTGDLKVWPLFATAGEKYACEK
jgi:hypothetical protein